MIEGEPALHVRPVTQLLLLGGLRQHDHVDQIVDQVIALLLRRYRRHIAADLLLGEGEVALADIDAVDAGDDRILVGGARHTRIRDRCQRGGDC